jgi:predicted RNA-binding Zn ribbon-like protein
VSDAYPGPVRDEPLAVELHNTLYGSGGTTVDGLAGRASAAAWLDAVRDRVPSYGTGRDPIRSELIALRDVVRDALRATVENRPITRTTIDTLNDASARAPRSPAVHRAKDGAPRPAVRYHSDRRADIVISAIAADAIELITGPARTQLRACRAPGCVLIFLKDHRQEWCSNACGNRARQARHYRRTHG